MQIILTQPQIEEAIVNHVLSIMTLKDGQSLEIDLRATRGDNGYTAEISVVSDVSTPAAAVIAQRPPRNVGVPVAPVRAAAVTAAAVTETPAADVQAEAEAAPEAAPEAEAETAEPAEKRASIFSNMKKPTGKVGQEVEAA